MKAVILAGGKAGGLWPACGADGWSSLTLLGHSLPAWTARLLADAGVDELLLTLPAGAQAPQPDSLCLPFTVFREEIPLGTAGALLPLAGALNGEDFLLVYGNVLWDLDLEPLLHTRLDCPAALLLCHSQTPQRFCAAAADETGLIRSIAAGPAPERCAATTVFAGIALCSPAVFSFLEGAADLEQDLFPRLAQAGKLRGVAAEGWRAALRTPEDLLQTSADLLSGKCRGLWAETPRQVGIWTRSPIPEDVEIVPPCRIGSGVTLGRGSLIGPHVSLEDGAAVGERCLIQRSVLQSGAAAGARSTIYGAVVCQKAVLGHYCVLNEGAVVGPSARVGDNAILMEEVRVGPGLSVPPSVRLTESLTAPFQTAPDSGGLTVEDMVKLGRRLGRCGTVGVGGEGFRGMLLARAAGCGAAAAGAAVLLHDGTRPEHAAWLARYYGWPASVFVDGDGEAYLFDAAGQSLCAPPPDGEPGEGSWDLLAGTAAAYEAALLREEERPQARPAFLDKKGLYFL